MNVAPASIALFDLGLVRGVIFVASVSLYSLLSLISVLRGAHITTVIGVPVVPSSTDGEDHGLPLLFFGVLGASGADPAAVSFRED